LTRVSEDILTYFDNVFADHTIDVQTGALLGRYIAEEHDTARLLRNCYDALLAAGDTRVAGVDDRINNLTAQVELLCSAVDDLGQIVRAQSAAADNGAADPAPKRPRR
jgi:hypothetical protein